MTFLTKNAPPGEDILAQTNRYFTALIVAVLWSLGFLFRYSSARNRLFYTDEWGRYLKNDAVMPEFRYLMGNAMLGVWVTILILVICIILNYHSFHQGSKSIYLMKRLPDPMELHRRCVLLPVLGMAICLALREVLVIVYFVVYMLVTPEGCLPPDQWQKFWSVLL